EHGFQGLPAREVPGLLREELQDFLETRARTTFVLAPDSIGSIHHASVPPRADSPVRPQVDPDHAGFRRPADASRRFFPNSCARVRITAAGIMRNFLLTKTPKVSPANVRIEEFSRMAPPMSAGAGAGRRRRPRRTAGSAANESTKRSLRVF